MPVEILDTQPRERERETFAVAGVITQYRAVFDVSEAVEQLAHVILRLLLVQHPDKQLPVICTVHTPVLHAASTF